MSKLNCVYDQRVEFDSEIENPPEHIIPYAAGGSDEFTICTVSKKGNSRAGSEIDGPFTCNFFIAVQRLLLQIKAKDGSLPKVRSGEGAFMVNDEIQQNIRAFLGKNGWEWMLVYCKHGETVDAISGERKIKYVINSNEMKKFIETTRMRYKDFKITTTSGCMAELPLTITSSTFDLTREYVKIALGSAVFKFGYEFSVSPEADILRKGMWSTSQTEFDSTKCKASVWPTFNNDKLISLFKNGHNHIVAIINLGDRIDCFILLFGLFAGQVELTSKISDYKAFKNKNDGVVVKIDPVTRKFEEINYMTFLASNISKKYGAT